MMIYVGFRRWLRNYSGDNLAIKEFQTAVFSNPPTAGWGYFELVTHMHMTKHLNWNWRAINTARKAYERDLARHVAKTTQPL